MEFKILELHLLLNANHYIVIGNFGRFIHAWHYVLVLKDHFHIVNSYHHTPRFYLINDVTMSGSMWYMVASQ